MIDFNKDWTEPPQAKIDFEKIKAVSENNIESILGRWLPGGRMNGREYVCGGTDGGRGESCSTNVNTCVGSDFATGEKWGDAIELVSVVEQCSMADAAKKLQSFLGIDDFTPKPAKNVPELTEIEKNEQVKRNAMALWVEGESCPPAHPYLAKKEVNADPGIRWHPQTGDLLIPLRMGQDILGVQRISADGTKKVNHGGRMSGCCHIIQGERDTVYVCEGYATAMTVHIATGKTVAMAVSAGNLASVGEKVAALYPTSRLVFAADNDQGGNKNPGVDAATKAVTKIGRGQVIAPPFPDGEKGDWNDYALIHGGLSVRNLLVKNIRQMFVDVHEIGAVETDFLIDGVMEMPCTGMVFGASGSGKSFFVLDLAFHVALGRPWLGKAVKEGPVIYVCGEGRHGIPRRLKAWEKHHGVKLPKGRFLVSEQRLSFEPEIVAEMIQSIDLLAEQIGRPVLVIIDTMARALPGSSDENSAKDTNGFFNECDRLQAKYGCSVVVVHHTGHGDGKRARGSSAIRGVLDTEILLAGGIIEWTKTKDMEPHKPIKYELENVVFGEGKRDTSCVIKYDENVKIAQKSENAMRKAAKSSLFESISAENIAQNKCTVAGWLERFRERYPDVSERDQRKKFSRQKNDMENDGLVSVDGAIVTVIDSGLMEDVSNALIFKDI
ncbi:MAG: AAA family ATPase [Zoogloea oleivorans]|jgi:phage/plasmid primase-like uncharacterized protein|uniref:AAA family ATPase n=1 Tax=Zoogloea oleivorans TaxID=1552750 RepID=UPI002A366EAB|nr:AAA family ATPase [Zoogloea oleivorans]MDY0037964.1 AAA family ATPase [Zoogloea oleivorans]